MITLKDIFLLMGYKETGEQIAYVKFLAYFGGFNQPDYYSFEEKETESRRYKRRIKLVAQALRIWKQTNFKKHYAEHKGNIISDQEALELLQTKLNPSFLLSFIWFYNIVDIYFLRKSFEEEGIDNKKIGINEQRWEQTDEMEISSFKEEKNVNAQLFQYARALHLIEGTPWPKDQGYRYVILLSSVDKYLRERINFLPKFEEKITLYFFTGARGAFNWEITTSLILAKWFNLPDKVNVIQNFLMEHQSKDPWQWYSDLSGLKKGLMDRLGVKEWPKAFDSYYYYPGNKEIYDLAAKQAGREPLDCEGGPWPVAEDLAQWILEERYKDDPKILKNIKLVPVATLGKNGRLATMSDMFEKWLCHLGKIPIEEGSPIVIVGCNATHFMPFANYNLTHSSLYQEAIFSAGLQNKLNQFNETKEGKPSSLSFQAIHWKIVGPPAQTFSFTKALDSMARAIFSLRKNIEKTISHFNNVEENIFESQAPSSLNITLAKRMVQYHQSKEYLFLANAVVDLAFSFYIQGNFVKTSGLFNFALNVLTKIKDREIKKLIKTLYRSTLVNMRHFVSMTNKKLGFPSKNIDLETLQSLDEKNRARLSLIRKKILTGFRHVPPDDSKKIFDLYKSISKKMQAFYLSLVDQAQTLLGKKTDDLALLFMGSYSRCQSTPYSDIELAIIINDNSHFELAKSLTKLTLLKIFQLKETILPSLGIWVPDKAGNPFYLASKIFDEYGKDGFSADRYVPLGCKFPLGRKDGKKVVYRLIGSPQFLASKLSSSYGFHRDPFIPQMLRFATYACGNKALYDKFLGCLSDNKDANSSSYGVALLNMDLEKQISYLDEIKTLSIIQNKKYLYRPINFFLDDLLVALGATKNMHNCEMIDLFFNLGIIDYPQKLQLANVLSYFLYLKLYQHFKYQEQRICIKNTDEIFLHIEIMQGIMKPFFVNLVDFLRQRETLILKNEYKMSIVYDFRMFKKFKEEKSASSKETVYPIAPLQ